METEWGQVPDDRVGVITADVTLAGAGAQPREKGSLRVTGGNVVLNVLPASLHLLRKGAKTDSFSFKNRDVIHILCTDHTVFPLKAYNSVNFS